MSASVGHQQRRHGAPQQDGPVNIQYGHNGTFVVLQFTRATAQLVLSIKQADDMLAALQQAKAMLENHVRQAVREREENA